MSKSTVDILTRMGWSRQITAVQAGRLMDGEVSKSQQLQCQERLRLLSSCRVPTRFVATQVYLSTAASGPLPFSCGETTHVQSSLVDNEEFVSS